MKFVVIEGIDGSGKSTQVKQLTNYLEVSRKPYKYLHFPRTNAPVFGDLIARFLRGDFGNIDTVDPYLVALLYAGDRNDAAPLIRKWMEEGHLVILDRYVYSNVAFQCAKIKEEEKRKVLKQWILQLEYDYYNIPKPDLSLFLDVPFNFTRSNLASARKGDDREYLQGMKDIHEENLDFQQKVREMYLWQTTEDENFVRINCSNAEGEIKPAAEIFSEILKHIKLL
jgi:dTMP kinase